MTSLADLWVTQQFPNPVNRKNQFIGIGNERRESQPKWIAVGGGLKRKVLLLKNGKCTVPVRFAISGELGRSIGVPLDKIKESGQIPSHPFTKYPSII